MKKLIVLSLILSVALNSFSQRKIRECAIVDGVLKEIEADYDPATGDRSIMVNGVKKDFYSVYPKNGVGYAEGQTWFVNNEEIQFKSKPFVKYGLPRILGVNEIQKSGSYKGVNVYTEAGINGDVEVIYLPVRQGCEFQPYQINCGYVDVEKLSSTATSLQLTAKTTGLKGNMTYQWSVTGAAITKGQGTATITVDISNATTFEAKVIVTDNKKCPVSSSYFGEGAKKKTASGWNKVEREAFMKSCEENTGMEAAASKAYCSCMLEKIVKLYPDPVEAEKKLTEENILPLAKECLKK